MKLFIDPEKVSVPEKANEMLERRETKKAAKLTMKEIEALPVKKEVKKRDPRPIRAFRYRGQPFMFINHEDLTLVCTVNKDTNKPEPIIEVPKEKASLAVRALTKIIQAESVLDGLKR